MSLRNRVALSVIAVLSLAFLVACGSGTHSPVAPPSGGFSNTNFNGIYTFSVFGADTNGTMALAGSFTACGCNAGTISSAGSVDITDQAGASGPLAVTGGNYSITKDGRGKASLTLNTTGGPLNIILDFVLTSSSHGLIIRFDGAGTGSGTIDQQGGVVAQSALAGPFAFSLSGSVGANPQLLVAFSTVGAFTLDASGNIAGTPAGVEDFTQYNTVTTTATTNQDVALTGGLTVGSGAASGTANLNTTAAFGNLTFDVYAIDATHLKLIENDGKAVLVGDVFSQSSATIPQQNLVFTMAGFDTSAFPFVAGGLMSSDGTSKINNGAEDVNDDGTVDNGTTTPFPFSGTFTAAGAGRFTVDLSGFAGGNLFAAYPSSGGLLMLEIDPGLGAGITSGVAMPQTATSIATSQGFGLNLTGVDTNGNFDAIAQFQTTSNSFTSGLLDENEGGAPENPQNFGGSYSVSSNGSGSATLTSGIGGMFFYVADSSTAVFISTDNVDVALGLFQAQSTPTSAAEEVMQRQASMVSSAAKLRAAMKRRQKTN
jgi:hypothetical protein